MKISTKLILAFGILMIGMIINAVLIYTTISSNNEITKRFKEVYQPSADKLQELEGMINKSKMLINNWVNEIPPNTPLKVELDSLQSTLYPELKKAIKPLATQWNSDNQKEYKIVTLKIDSLFNAYTEIKGQLKTLLDYDDPMVIFSTAGRVEQGGDVNFLFKRTVKKLNVLLDAQNKIVEEQNEIMQSSSEELINLIFMMTGILAVLLVIIAFITIRAIVKPMSYITKVTKDRGIGFLPDEPLKVSKDEVGQMSEALNALVGAFSKQSEFALEVGHENFEHQFEPLSKEDQLGNALLAMRDGLKKAKIEEEKRAWTTEGLASFGEVLGETSELNKLGQKLIEFLSSYIGAYEGRIFIINEDSDIKEEYFLKRLSYYPDNHSNKEESEVQFSKQHLLGNTFYNKSTKYLLGRDIPKAYLLKPEKRPKSILVVPLTVEEKYVGVIEISSLKKFSNEEVAFVEHAAARIASTLLLFNINYQTQLLLGKLQVANVQLKENEEQLEQKVIERTAEVVEKSQEIEEKNKHITASINYAKRIQEAMLPQYDSIKKALPNSFILFKPRDIVSGDFYWFAEVGNKIIITAIDCTGHGVPGALMSMIGNSYLNQIVQSGVTDSDLILNELHVNIRRALKQGEVSNNDGMDMALVVIDKDKNEMQFTGAKNPLIYIQDGELTQVKANKFPIGGQQREEQRIFSKTIVDISKPTTLYLFTDGYQDQTGGPRKRKFMTKNFRQMLHEVSPHPMDKQKEILESILREWQGEMDQIDDILVIGVKL